MDIGAAVTLGGASILVGIIVEAFKRAFAWGQAQVDRFGPVFSMGVGVIVVLLLSAAQGTVTAPANLASAIITGLLAGAAASGLYDATQTRAGGTP